MFPFILETTQGILNSIGTVISATWWIIIPLVLGFIFWDFWKYYVYVSYLRNIKWVLLELKIPAIVEKTPKAMEQMAAYGLYSFGFNLVQKYWEGRLVEDFISFEMVGQGGGVHFYIRTPAPYRNLLESAIYAQYPDAEIQEAAEDYRDNFSKTLPNKTYDIFGMDYHLARESAYPIRTYMYFEEKIEEQRLDPIAAVAEVMSKLKEDEALWIQVLVRPTGPEWKKEGDAIRDKLIGRKPPARPATFVDSIVTFFKNLTLAPVEHPQWPTEKKEEERSRLLLLTPGERDIIESIENKISKLGFEANIRFIYIDKRESFTRSNVAAFMGTVNQFNTLHLNGLRPNLDTMTIIRGNIKWFKNSRLWFRKRQIWDNYRLMRWPGKRSILNTEELATLYHVPATIVEAPLLRRVGAVKGGPPAGLPTE